MHIKFWVFEINKDAKKFFSASNTASYLKEASFFTRAHSLDFNGIDFLERSSGGHIGQGGPNLFLSSQTDKLMAATKFSNYLGLNHYKKAKK